MIIDRRQVYTELEDFLKNASYDKELFILSGVYGVGKTTLLTVLNDKLKSSLHIHLNFNKPETDGLVSLKNAVCDFIELNKVKKKKKDFKISGFLSIILNAANFKASASIGTTPSVSVELNILEVIRKTIETRYENYINTTNQTNSREFPETLARIVKEIINSIGERLFITLDEIEKMDSNSAVFIYGLLKSESRINLICSTESKNTEINNRHFLDTVNSYFTSNIETTKCYSSKLNEFSILETLEYINKRYNSNFSENDPLIQKIHEKTAGLPLLLSIVCINNSLTDIETLTLKTETEEWLGRIYNETINSLDEGSRNTLFMVSIAGGNIYESVLESVMEIPKQDLYGILEILQKKALLSYEEESGEFYIKYKILSEYIQMSNHISSFQEKRHRENIINAYENYPIQSINKAKTLSFLYLKSTDYRNAFKWSKEYGQLSLKKCMPDKYIEDIIKIMQVIQLEAKNIAQLRGLLITAHYRAGNMESCIGSFNELMQEEIDSLLESEDYSIICGIVAQAYYYKNDYSNTILFCRKALENCKGNNDIFQENFLRLISSYDLSGQYYLALENYNKGVEVATERADYYAKGCYLMVTQMIHNQYQECCIHLLEAIEIFKNINTSPRHLACVHSNLGIEYLMNNNQVGALSHFKEAERIFQSLFPLELHFVQNNLGLYYYLNHQYYDAKNYLNEALSGAISPLQYAYIYNNLAILDIVAFEGKDAENLYTKALSYLENCPDPIVYCNVKFNYSKYCYKSGETSKVYQHLPIERLKSLNAKQYAPLIKKITDFGLLIGCEVSNDLLTQQSETDRRSFFIQHEWQLCELMFYN